MALPYTSLLEEALESWEDVRGGVIEELEIVPEEKLGFHQHTASGTAGADAADPPVLHA